MTHFGVGMLAMVAGFSIVLAAASAPAAESSPDVLKTLRAGHPRLFLTPDSVKALRAAAQSDPAEKDMFARIRTQADKMLKDPPVEYVLIGPRLLDKSRRCLERATTLSFVYQLTGEEKYAARAAKELEATAAFQDWHPAHFLDTAEMTCAFGIGYDWLYSYLSKEQRAVFRKALIEKGLTPGLESYRGTGKFGWWVKAHHNWSQVCNGGLAVGALAIADEEPALAREVLDSGLKAVQGAMGNFGPDGSWNEGPGYWGYTLMYTSYYLGAMQTALGTMRGLEQAPGLSEAGLFRLYFTGPTQKTFNFADAHEGAGSAPAMFWLARTFRKPVCAWHERQMMKPSAFDLIWYSLEGRGPAAEGLPTAKYFRRDDVVFMRSAWEDPQALWIGVKGGDNAANHSHLDIGSFVLDALGERWAWDLGGDDYNLPSYFGNKRWTYYRLKTESHNTLLINNENQNPKAKAPVVAFAAEKGDAYTVIDLSQAYPMAKSVQRGVNMQAGKRILIQDEVEAGAPVDCLWGMITRAKASVQGPAVVLEQNGKRLYGRVLSPAGAVFDTVGANPPPPEGQQPDAKKLVVKLPEKSASVRLAVVFSTDPNGAAPSAAPLKPLAQWPGHSK